MTLALYGKTKRRQGGLMLVALLAVLIATFGGVASLERHSANALSSGAAAAPTAHESATCANPENAYVASYVSCDDGESVTYTTFNYGVPVGATITGIEVTLDQATHDDDGTDGVNVAVHNGTSFSTNVLAGTNTALGLTPSDTDTVGGPGNLLGLSWTVAGANAIKVRVTGETAYSGIPDPQQSYFDNVQVKIYYTVPVAPGPVTLQGVTPTPLTGNPTCEGQGQGWTGFKIDRQNDDIAGTWNASSANTSGSLPSGGSVTITILPDGTGGQFLFSWTSNFGVDAVIVKQGGDGSPATNLYVYNPEDQGDSGLGPTQGLNNSGGVSHVVFCWDADATGTVVVKKITTGSGSSTTDQFGGVVKLGAATAQTFTDLSASSPKVYTSQPTGSYTVEETNVNGYTRLGYAVGGGTAQSPTCPVTGPVAQNPSAAQTLAANNDTIVFCVYNEKHALVLDPSVSKTKNGDGVTGGFAYWNVNVNNTINAVSAYDVTIIDTGASFVSVSGGACAGVLAGASLNSPGIACTAAANSTMVVKVSKPFGPATTCLAQTINNTATVKDIAGNTIGGSAVGGTAATEYTIPADPTKCESTTTVTKTAPLNSYTPGDQFTWTITWTVSGGSTNAAQVYSDVLPVAFEFQTPLAIGNQVDPGNSLGCSAGTNNVDCTLQAGAIAGTYSQEVLVKVKSTATCGSVTNFVKSGGSTNQGATVASDEVTIVCGSTAVTKTAPADSYTLGDQFTWTITWTVSGGSTNAAQVYSDVLPAAFEFQTPLAIGNQVDPGNSLGCSAGTNNVDCTLQAGAIAGTYSQEVLVKVKSTATCGSVTNFVKSGGSTNQGATVASDEVTIVDCDKLIQIIKFYQGLNGYSPTALDLPTFTLSDPVANVPGSACTTQDNGSNVVLTCTVPTGWNGSVSETPKTNWVEVFDGECSEQESLRSSLMRLVSNVLATVTEDQVISATFTFCNAPTGNIIVQKTDGTAGVPGRPANWQFGVSSPDGFADSDTINLGGGQYTITGVPLGNGYAATETNGDFSQCPAVNETGTWRSQALNGAQNLTAPGQTITFAFSNQPCSILAGTGNLIIHKYRDIDGDHVLDAGETGIAGWTINVQGPQFPAGQNFTTDASGTIILPGLTDGVYTLTEATQPGYVVIGVVNGNGSFSAGTVGTGTVALNQTTTVNFFNQPKGSIEVTKTTTTRHNGGPEVPAPQDRDGWKITLVSFACNVNVFMLTDSNGKATFSNLTACSDYVVAEDLSAPGAAGYQVVGNSSVSNVTPGNPATQVNFTNRRETRDPVCTINCTPLIFETPTPVPTVVPPTPTRVPPTVTPVPPTATPVNVVAPVVDTAAGARTPGALSTPIAPSTGTGFTGTTGSINGLLALVGMVILASGFAIVALGKKQR